MSRLAVCFRAASERRPKIAHGFQPWECGQLPQRGYGVQPKVASNGLPWVCDEKPSSTPTGLWQIGVTERNPVGVLGLGLFPGLQFLALQPGIHEISHG